MGNISVERLDFVRVREILSETFLSLVVILAALIPIGLLIMKAACMRPNALPIKEILLPFTTHALEVVLSTYNNAIGFGSETTGFVTTR